MAKSRIRKTDPAETKAPTKRRRIAASDTGESKPAVKAAPRSRRKTETPVAITAPQVDPTAGEAESTADVSHDQIAVRAYHIYLERGHAGDSFHDWVTAERELREQVSRPRG